MLELSGAWTIWDAGLLLVAHQGSLSAMFDLLGSPLLQMLMIAAIAFLAVEAMLRQLASDSRQRLQERERQAERELRTRGA